MVVIEVWVQIQARENKTETNKLKEKQTNKWNRQNKVTLVFLADPQHPEIRWAIYVSKDLDKF